MELVHLAYRWSPHESVHVEQKDQSYLEDIVEHVFTKNISPVVGCFSYVIPMRFNRPRLPHSQAGFENGPPWKETKIINDLKLIWFRDWLTGVAYLEDRIYGNLASRRFSSEIRWQNWIQGRPYLTIWAFARPLFHSMAFIWLSTLLFSSPLESHARTSRQ